MPGTIALIDGHYYAYRFFFGMPPLTGPGGKPTGVTFAFANLFLTLRQDPEITHWLLVLDHEERSFRNALDPTYKAHRDPMPEALQEQVGDLPALAQGSGVPLAVMEGFEADDIIGTLARRAAAEGMQVRILTRDKDIDQVLSDRIRTWDTFGKEGPGLRGPQELLAEKGLTPAQVIDYLCMVGDSADNINGITGVGPKTAAKLLAEYGTLEAVMQNRHLLKGKLKDNVEAFVPHLALTRELVRLREVPMDFAPETMLIDRGFPGDEAVYRGFGLTYARYFSSAAKSEATRTRVRIAGLAELRAMLAASSGAGTPIALHLEATGADATTCELVGLAVAGGVDQEGRVDDGRSSLYCPLMGSGGPVVSWSALQGVLAAGFADPRLQVVSHDGKQLARLLLRHGVVLPRLAGDTMLASWLLDPSRESHALDFLVRMFLVEEPAPPSDPPLPRLQPEMAAAGIEQAAAAACETAQCIWRLEGVLRRRMQEVELLGPYQEIELPIALVLAGIEDAGIGIDAQALTAIQRHLEVYLEQVTASIRRIAGDTFNPGSPRQIAELLFEKLGLPVLQKTKTGPSTEAWVLEALRHRHELPDLLLQYRSLTKLLGTYLARLPDWINPRTQRIHSRFRQTGTETGRISSDQPNLQNIPTKSDLGREIRSAFIARPGCMFIAADYSQIELRVLADLSGDETLREAFAGDTDIHRFVAARINGVAEAAVTPQQRSAAKAVNFGIIYGQSAFGLAQGLGIPRAQAQHFIDDYFARFSRVKGYIREVIELATARHFSQTIAGRRRYIPQLASGNRNERLQGERIALNSTIQGSAADIIKSAMLRCQRQLPQGARMVLQIHDELVVEAEDAVATEAAQQLTSAMTGAWKLTVPLIAEASSGRTWLEVS